MTTIIIFAILAFLFDKISKMLILSQVFDLSYPVTNAFGKTLPIIDDVFHLTYHGNTGMAFGMFAGNKVFLIVTCVILLGAILFYAIKYKPKSKFATIGLGMIIGGAVGNVADRLQYGFVIDFLDFRIINYPIFNIADCCIVVGAILFSIYILFFDKKEDNLDK